MPDVVALLDVPPPWHAHGTGAELPPAHGAILGAWPGPPSDLFKTSGTVEEVIDASSLVAPGFTPGETLETRDFAPGDLSRLRAELETIVTDVGPEARPEARPVLLRLSGPILWNGTLGLEHVTGLALDFTAATPEVATNAPLIRLSRCGRIAIRGLAIGQRNSSVMDIDNSHDIALTDSALSGASDCAIGLTGQCARVLIDRSAFLRNDGPAIRARGEALSLIVAHSAFEGPAPAGYIALAPAGPAARGFPEPLPGEPCRDVLSTSHPTEVRILENRFAPCAAPAITARGTAGLWIERNDFTGATHSALYVEGPAAGLMLANNRLSADPNMAAPLVHLADTAIACLFRNAFEPAAAPALSVTGASGGLLVAENTFTPLAPGAAPPAAIDFDTGATFLTTNLTRNTIRGPFGSGVVLRGKLPRLFLFDNDLSGMTEWSFDSRVHQPYLTSYNNRSPKRSRNITMAQRRINLPRVTQFARRAQRFAARRLRSQLRRLR